MSFSRIIYFGPPGTGKTTTLLNRLEEHLAIDRIPPEQVAFLTFTRRARREAIDRVEVTLNIRAKDLPHFRTIHSMAFRALKLGEGDVMGREQMTEFGTMMGLTFGDVAIGEQAAEGIGAQNIGDQLLAIDNLARLRGVAPRAVWSDARSSVDWPLVDQFCRSYAAYKKDKGLLDFTDVLAEYVERGSPLDIALAFIDEAQDLSALQWRAALRAIGAAPTQYIAGDDDQAVYRWAGAEVEKFIELAGERVILSHSYRLPRAVQQCGARILKRIKCRVPKEFTARDVEGVVARHATHEALPLGAGGQWLWLVRNRYLLWPLSNYLTESGIVFTMHGQSSVYETEREAIYTWERLRKGTACPVTAVRSMYAKLRSGTQIKRGHKLLPECVDDALLTMEQLRTQHGLMIEGAWFDVFATIPLTRRMYYRRLLRDHGTLKLAPTVQLETIHGSKGAEAQKVALFLEQSRRTWEEAHIAPDEEHRVWYVGTTRAREELHVVEASGHYAYHFPHQTQVST